MSTIRNTPTSWFGMHEKPQIDGVYRVKCLHWLNTPRYSLWKNGQWHMTDTNRDVAEKETKRSILLYENCGAGWCGVVEKPEWA